MSVNPSEVVKEIGSRTAGSTVLGRINSLTVGSLLLAYEPANRNH